MTTAPTAGSASSSSIVATISATSGAVSALRRSGSSRVRRATRSCRSTWRGTARSGLLAHDGGRVPEERLDVSLVLVRRPVAADRALEAEAPRERVDGARSGVLVAEAGLLERAVVEGAPVAEEAEHLRWEVEDPSDPQRFGRPLGEQGRQRDAASPDDGAHLAPWERAVARDVEDTGHVVERREHERSGDVRLVRELEPGVEAEHLGDHREPERLGKGRGHVVAEH